VRLFSCNRHTQVERSNLPKSTTGKFAFVLWLVAAIALLTFAFVQRAIHDMPEAFIWLLVLLNFPLGLVGAATVGLTWPAISAFLGLGYQPLIDLIPYWVLVTAIGYFQWFKLLPAIIRRLSGSKTQ
ncbi:hypothetical protein, partial [Aquabacterium sp.]|uniref:hypothetical protein n=1 Tax=Aquabacterium sp. TaxID=1872578 RepID=UPI002E32A0D6